MCTVPVEIDGIDGTDILLCEVKRGILCFVESELQADTWAESKKSIKAIILNYFKNALEAHPEDFSEDIALFKENYDKGRAIFDLKVYRDTMRKGFSVAFTIKINDKPYYLYSTSSKELRFQEGVPPQNIPGNTSNIIFYQKNFTKGNTAYFVFESAMDNGYCLAFQSEGGKERLILKHSPEDVVDETKRLEARLVKI